MDMVKTAHVTAVVKGAEHQLFRFDASFLSRIDGWQQIMNVEEVVRYMIVI